MSVQPPGRYGALNVVGMNVNGFLEKPRGDGGWINAGFFVLSPKVMNLVENDSSTWEAEPLRHLATSGQLMTYPHHGFWQPMDTLRDKNQMEEMWSSGKAPWKVW